MSTKSIRIAAVSAALAGGALVGGLIAAPLVSGAQETTTTAPATAPAAPTTDASGQTQAPPKGNVDPKLGGHTNANGDKEELLTGDTATKVTEAALAANPGATIERVETDVDDEGSVYEAHIVTADGAHKTVLFDANFAITTTLDGPAAGGPGGPGGHGGHGPRGQQGTQGQQTTPTTAAN